MAEQPDKDQQTEKPTQRRLEEARRKGNVPMSRDVTAIAVLGMLTILLVAAGGTLARDFTTTLRPLLAGADAIDLGRAGELTGVLAGVLGRVGWAAAPILAVLVLAAVIGTLGQNGLVISAERIQPKLERVSPMAGLKRMFSLPILVELVKGTLKIAVIAIAGWMAVRPSLDGLDMMPLTEPAATARVAGGVLLDLLIYVSGAMLVIAVLDAGWQRFSWWRKLHMSREELRDEHKQMEGNPEIKARLKMLRRQRARRRMMAAVPEATVVITNPTHFAVALHYDRATMRAPKCVAKGQDRVAQRIREVAAENGVPVVENKPLARALFHSIEIDQDVPPEHYRAVAEVISYVFSLRSARA
jgi:flagellar biosynthetic protein FlhB